MLYAVRDNEQLAKYQDNDAARAVMWGEVKKLIEGNPVFRDKLVFPTIQPSRLVHLVNQRYGSCILEEYANSTCD